MKPGPLLITLAILLASAATLTLAFRGAGPAPPTDHAGILFPPDVDVRVPAFALTDDLGQAADGSLLDGGYTVLDFIFTNCPFACPGMASAMLEVQRRTEGTGVRLLSISVDGEHDTPAVLRAYADSIGADSTRWRFLTGPGEAVRAIIVDGIGLSLERDASRAVRLPDGSEMANYDHPTRLLLVGPDRRVIASASYLIDEEVDGLIELALERRARQRP